MVGFHIFYVVPLQTQPTQKTLKTVFMIRRWGSMTWHLFSVIKMVLLVKFAKFIKILLYLLPLRHAHFQLRGDGHQCHQPVPSHAQEGEKALGQEGCRSHSDSTGHTSQRCRGGPFLVGIQKSICHYQTEHFLRSRSQVTGHSCSTVPNFPASPYRQNTGLQTSETPAKKSGSGKSHSTMWLIWASLTNQQSECDVVYSDSC